MKKRLEADLISIAHRILQLKNKSDINQLYLETQKLYEKLAVLRFVDAEFGDTKPTIGQAEIEKQIEEAFDKKEVPQPEPVIVEEAKTETTAETPLETAPENDSLFQVDDAEIEEEIISENIEIPVEEVENTAKEEETKTPEETIELKSLPVKPIPTEPIVTTIPEPVKVEDVPPTVNFAKAAGVEEEITFSEVDPAEVIAREPSSKVNIRRTFGMAILSHDKEKDVINANIQFYDDEVSADIFNKLTKKLTAY